MIYLTQHVTKDGNLIAQQLPLFLLVDDSGWWGKGGVFTALSKRSHSVEKQYELAAKMKGER